MTDLLRGARMGYRTKLNLQVGHRTWTGTGPWPGVSAGDLLSDRDFRQTWDSARAQPGTQGILIQYGGGSGAHAPGPGRGRAERPLQTGARGPER
ncbi:hypothetical protein [Kitasatospora sp. NPDC050543]|uniref:hypothetical protein n=1 Tax=Kitasatospora sp. NPDC050543 TaxID=3364054 RepID=UPI003792CE58